MQFTLLLIDPHNYRYTHFLHTLCRAVAVGLEALGHDCCIQRNALDPARTTIVMGGHLLREAREVEAIAAAGPYIVYQTEMLAWQVPELHGAAGSGGVYATLLRRAHAVWDVSPANLGALESLGVCGHVLRLGYHPLLAELDRKRQRDIDFLFFGSVTPHRQRMLEALAARGRSVVVLFDEPALVRNDFIARAKVHLSLSHGPGRDHLPWPRIAFLLNQRCLVVSERCADQEWLHACFAWAETADWVALCETLLSEDTEALAERFFERFHSMPLTLALEQALDAGSGRVANIATPGDSNADPDALRRRA